MLRAPVYTAGTVYIYADLIFHIDMIIINAK